MPGVSSIKVAAPRRPAAMRHAMHDCASRPVSITVADRTVGLAVAEGRGYRFVSVDPRFGLLDGSRLGRVTDARRAADRLVVWLRDVLGTLDHQRRPWKSARVERWAAAGVGEA